MTASRPWDEAAAESYRDDPAFALELLNDVLRDGRQDELLVLLRQLTIAFGGVRSVAKAARLNPTQLYRTLSKDGNPALSTLSAVLRTMGLQVAIRPLAPGRRRRHESQ